MKILVCVKVCKGEINPFDESALECALRLSDDVTVISMGPDSAKNVLLPLTRLGAKVELISDKLYAGSDTLATSYILHTAIKRHNFDLILTGKQSIDGDTAQVGPMLSSFLGIPLVTNVLELDSKLNAKTREGEETITLPAIATIERSYVLRFPGIFSKLSEISVIDNSILCCDERRCGLNGSPTRVIKTFENNLGKRKCKFIAYDELIPLVKELSSKESRTVIKKAYREKLECVWAIGKEVYEKGKEIADNVILIEKTSAQKICELIKAEKPEVVLWNADLWGRKTAPQAAALLNTGLCADCTELEIENGKFIMYRPAQGNSIYAKIECITSPKMATVRTKSESSAVILSGGRGIADNMDKLQELADILGAEIAGSRGLVDSGKIPYPMQVGLTGKTVAPAVYIAVGISGAVQHTCAIESAKTVIAINPDKDARIFEYADYGIIKEF